MRSGFKIEIGFGLCSPPEARPKGLDCCHLCLPDTSAIFGGMAGRPRRRAMLAALDDRTRMHFEGDRERTHLDYVCAWVESGRTIRSLTAELMRESGVKELLPSVLGNYLRSEWPDELGAESANARLSVARRIGAHAKAEETEDIAAEGVADSADAARQRNRIGVAQWLAGTWNRDEYGQSKGPQVSVTVDARALHLDALRARSMRSVLNSPNGQDGVLQIDTPAGPAALPAATESATPGLADLL